MPENRKNPPGAGSRPGGGTLPAEPGEFSIESTTMRLKSLKLRRVEQEEAQVELERARKLRVDLMSTSSPGAAGRITHDERGAAVWDWAVATGEFAALSTTNVMRKLGNVELKIEETQRTMKALDPANRDAAGGGNPYDRGGAGGGDPYNQRGASSRTAPRPAPKPAAKPAAPKPPATSVLDQLLGRKK